MIYALRISNENERLHILNAVKGNIYICEYCGDRLIPNQGKIMPWHYRHKKNRTCTIGERSGIGCIINTEYNNGYCRGSIECEQECTLNRSFGSYVLSVLKESFHSGIEITQNFLKARWKKH